MFGALGDLLSTVVSIFDSDSEVVLKRYRVSRNAKNVLGQGAFTVCYRGLDLESGNTVAVRYYKSSVSTHLALSKLQHLVRTLEDCQTCPVQKASEPGLWHPRLAAAKPSELFVNLYDFPHPLLADPNHEDLFAVMEFGEASLAQRLRAVDQHPLAAEEVHTLASSLVLAAAVLHAKGIVHMDLKPENVLLCGGRAKLIDFDGCMHAGTTLSAHDSICFSLPYAAPEFARFTVQTEQSITVDPSLDVWSTGLMLCELCTRERALSLKLKECDKKGAAWAKWHLPRWLAKLEKAPVPDAIFDFDPRFHGLIEALLSPDPARRPTLARSFDHPYLDNWSRCCHWSPPAAPLSTSVESKFPPPRVDVGDDCWFTEARDAYSSVKESAVDVGDDCGFDRKYLDNLNEIQSTGSTSAGSASTGLTEPPSHVSEIVGQACVDGPKDTNTLGLHLELCDRAHIVDSARLDSARLKRRTLMLHQKHPMLRFKSSTPRN